MSTGKSSRYHTRTVVPKGIAQESAVSAALLTTVDLGLGAIIFVAPHLFGGRHPLGGFVIVAFCVVTALAWFLRQLISPQVKWTRFHAWIVPLLAATVVMLQLVPMPGEWMPTLSPRLHELLPLWTGANSAEAHLGSWKTLSLAPEETRLALATLVAYALLFVTAVERLETSADIYRLMRMIGLSAVSVAGFGIVQYFTSNGKFFWFYEHPFTNTSSVLKAGFTSRNHFAHFLVLGFAMLLAWALLERQSKSGRSHAHRSQMSRRGKAGLDFSNAVSWILVAMLLVVGCSILASLSRGGILALGTVVLVAALIYARIGLLSSNHLLVGGLMLVMAMAALSISGKYDALSSRLDNLTSQDVSAIDSMASRQTIWTANLAAIKEGWLTGSGAGTHRFIYPVYLTEPAELEYTHAENGYLQIATENGLPGLVLLVTSILVCCYWCVSSLRHARGNFKMQIMIGGIAAALAASAVHSLVDFVWFVPACACTTLLILASLLRLHQIASTNALHNSIHCHLAPTTRFNLALGVTLAGVWAVATLLAPARVALEWDAYLHASMANQHPVGQRSLPSANQQEKLSASENLNSTAMLEHLSNVVRDYPYSARAHARLAGALLSAFEKLQSKSENPMPIGQIREAAWASSFPSAETLRAWLNQAFGKRSQLLYQAHYHARRSLELCPLEGEAYLCLAELCFLEGRTETAYETYARQGLQVCPCDCKLLFAIGKNELIAGDETEANRLWGKAFRGQGNHREHIIRLSTVWMPADKFIEIYQPDWDTLNSVWNVYRQIGDPENLETLLPYAAQQADLTTPTMTPNVAGVVWLSLAKMQKEIIGPEAALESLQQAYILAPDRFAIRYELGKCLLALEQFIPAETHLNWCFQHIPNDPTLRRDLEKATRGRMQELARNTQTSLR